MEKQIQPKQRVRHPDRISLEPRLLDKLDRFIEQVVNARKGVRISRKDFIFWLINKQPDELCSEDIKELSQAFYNEERFLQDALRELKSAKARGETLSLDDLLKRRASPKLERKKRGKLPNSTDASEATSIVQTKNLEGKISA